MELYEVVEVCPHCMGENIMQWNTEEMGFVARCGHCGEKMMLCDECLHTILEDGEPHDCDWCDDCNGVCHRDTSLVTLETYGKYDKEKDEHHILYFDIPKNWLKECVVDGWGTFNSLDEFMSSYTWDNTLFMLLAARKEKVVKNEREV